MVLDWFLRFNTPNYGLTQNKIKISGLQLCVQLREEDNPESFDKYIRWLIVQFSAWLVTKSDIYGNKAVFLLLQDTLGHFEYAGCNSILNQIVVLYLSIWLC